MPRRMVSGRDDIEKALSGVGVSLAHEVTAYLIGGCAMLLYNAKVATKDIDVVLSSEDDASAMIAALSTSGFAEAEPDDETYRRLGTTIMMRDSGGARFDIFVDKVCRKLGITDSMISRSTRQVSTRNSQSTLCRRRISSCSRV